MERDARRDPPGRPRTGQSFYNDHVWSQLRLSSKSHWDVPVKTPAGVVHALVSHRPPVFDGPEKRNAARNHDELRLWQEYLSKGDKPWLCDDKGHCGLAQDARFVILGDLNNDPVDGDGAMRRRRTDRERPRAALPHPRSVGGEQTSLAYAAKGIERRRTVPRHRRFRPEVRHDAPGLRAALDRFRVRGQRHLLASQ